MRAAVLALAAAGVSAAEPVSPGGAAASSLKPLALSEEQARPNILLTVVDDWGYGDVGYHDQTMHTPEMDSLAAAGIVLESFYSAPTCTPSRAMLMTGRYNIRTGMQDSVLHSTEPRGVPLDERFLPQKLAEAGYRTAGVGKWHLGMVQEAYLPQNRGFDWFYGIYTGGGSHTGHFSVSQPFTVRGQSSTVTWQGFNLFENGEVSPDNYGQTHSTHLYTAKAIEYVTKLEQGMLLEGWEDPNPVTADETPNKAKPTAKRRLASQSDSPWFVYLSYQAVHDPITVGDEKYVSQTRCANASSSEDSAVRKDASISATNRPLLCGMMAEVDDGLKSIRLALSASVDGAQDAWANTLLVLHSDNGGVRAHGSANLPLRGEKAEYFEGGVRVPALLAGGWVEAALARCQTQPYSSSTLSHLVDVHATLLDVAQYQGNVLDKDSDGASMMQHMLSPASVAAHRDELLINLNSPTFGGSGAVIVGHYKLMLNAQPNEALLYTKVRKVLAGETGLVPTDTFANIVAAVRSEVLDSTEPMLFDLEQNPTEREDRQCAEPAACSNLYELAAFAAVRAQLELRWAQWQSDAQPSSFAWEDDGPLASPDLFAGTWAPWRDADNTPMAHYFGDLDVVQQLNPPLAHDAQTTTTTTTTTTSGEVPETSSKDVDLDVFVLGDAWYAPASGRLGSFLAASPLAYTATIACSSFLFGGLAVVKFTRRRRPSPYHEYLP